MSEKNATNQAEQAVDEDKKNVQGVVDYLQAPRKKRKNFVVVATKGVTDPETTSAIVRFVKAAYPKFSVATPQNTEEFVRQFSRNIILAIIDDEFLERQKTLELIKLMKERKNEAAIPVLFMTKDPDALIQQYTKTLAVWHEVDDYAVPSVLPRQYLFSKVKSGIDEKYRRRSRRFKINFPTAFTTIDTGPEKFQGRIIDMSIHGALLEGPPGHIFTLKDQLLIHLPIGRFIKDIQMDVLRLSARIRRIFISGNTVGVSWEYLTESKIEMVTSLLTTIVDGTLLRQANATRARIAKAEAEASAATRTISKKELAEKKEE